MPVSSLLDRCHVQCDVFDVARIQHLQIRHDYLETAAVNFDSVERSGDLYSVYLAGRNHIQLPTPDRVGQVFVLSKLLFVYFGLDC